MHPFIGHLDTILTDSDQLDSTDSPHLCYDNGCDCAPIHQKTWEV